MDYPSLSEVRRLVEEANVPRWRGEASGSGDVSDARRAERRLDDLFGTAHAETSPKNARRIVGATRLSPAFGESTAHAAWSARRHSRSNFARPYMLLLIAFNFVICPSVCPFDQGSVQPASTAASSRRTL